MTRPRTILLAFALLLSGSVVPPPPAAVVPTPRDARPAASLVDGHRGAPERSGKPLGIGSLPFLDSRGAALDAASEETRQASPAEFDLATGSARLSGAPLPGLSGLATWYADPRRTGLYGAAGPVLRAALGENWRGASVRVGGPGGAAVDVSLLDFCACGERHGKPTLVDLSPGAFSALAPLSWGTVEITITGAVGALPATDTPDQHPEDPPEHEDDRRMRIEDGGPIPSDTSTEGSTP